MAKLNVLLVDDELADRLMLKDMMEIEGWKVVSAQNGKEAAELLESTPVDLIVCDIFMPVMDGFKFHQLVRSHPKHNRLPFLFISGFGDEFTAGAVQDPRVDAFYRKGEDFEFLLSRTQSLIESAHQKP